jgi:hypothetical protein
MEVTPVGIGDAVVYVDAVGRSHHALVTNVWGEFYDTPAWTTDQAEAQYAKWTRPEHYTEDEWDERKQALVGTPHTNPSINLVFVSDDDSQSDPYGRQIARQTSVCHKNSQPAHGMYWMNT